MRGFHICILRLSSHVDWIKLLDQSTTAPGWPAPHIMNDEMEDGREFTEVSDDPVLKVRSTYVKGIFIFFGQRIIEKITNVFQLTIFHNIYIVVYWV